MTVMCITICRNIVLFIYGTKKAVIARYEAISYLTGIASYLAMTTNIDFLKFF